MKKKLCNINTASVLLLTLTSIAQPTLTATGINPVAGESFVYIDCNYYVSPGNAGANQTYNLSSINGSSSAANFVLSSSTPYASNFPMSNIAINDGTDYDYWKTSSNALQLCGSEGSNYNLTYTDFFDWMRFPFTFNNNFTDSFAGNGVLSGTSTDYWGQATYTADGWGTLITQAGTFSNTLRVRWDGITHDSALGFPTTSYFQSGYFWYKEGFHLYLAMTYTDSSTIGVFHAASYLSNPTGIAKLANPISSISIYPNPANEKITIHFQNSNRNNLEVRIVNTLGENVMLNRSQNIQIGENTIVVETHELANGIYFAQIISDGNVSETKRFIVSK